jgi:hypothetical protein
MPLAYRQACSSSPAKRLAGDRGVGLDYGVVEQLAEQDPGGACAGVQLGLVVGGGKSCAGPPPARRARSGLGRLHGQLPP